jgi:hypothetical protein
MVSSEALEGGLVQLPLPLSHGWADIELELLPSLFLKKLY